uniref:Uncharacterized protein n=1 Tax=uncultured prokaryote TaxID=198431 RepID=A0A0H5QKY3_9ZZZZ|nr:hypothetical protein [uncultured prokaryote]
MATYRAMVIIKGESGLPEDVFVNTWHFTDGPASTTREGTEDAIAASLDTFYDNIDQFISTAVTTDVEYRIYDLADPQPRPPRIIEAGWVPTGGGAQLPTEVAVCLSFYKDRNIPRSRGRLYIGPLTIATSSNGRPGAALTTALLTGATELVDLTTAPGSEAAWAVYSVADGLAKNITDGWVDNAFDTQRRRGDAPTARETFPVVV